MKRNGLLASYTVAFVIFAVAFSPAKASSQSAISFGALAGVSLPTNKRDYSTGWHMGGLLDWKYPGSSVTFRADVAYDDLGSSITQKEFLFNGAAADYHYDPRAFSGTANILWSPPMGSTTSLKPYLRGGVGVYRISWPRTGTCLTNCGTTVPTFSFTKPGANIGAGISVPVAGLNTGIEAVWHRVFNKDSGNEDPNGVSIIRLSALVHF